MSSVGRRQALRLLGRAGLGAASSPLWAQSLVALADEHALHPPAAPAAADWVPKALDAHQNDMVVALCELIIPATDTPGAKAALVNRFIDTVIDDADEPDSKAFLRGLAWMDARSQELFGNEFLKAGPEQQAALLTILSSGKNTALDDLLGVEFFQAIKELTVRGYYTSEVGMQELKEDGQLFHVEFRGCSHPQHGGTSTTGKRA